MMTTIIDKHVYDKIGVEGGAGGVVGLRSCTVHESGTFGLLPVAVI